MSESRTARLFKQPALIILFASLSCFLWGSAFPALKYSYAVLGIKGAPYTTDLQFAGYRFLTSAALIMVFMLVGRQSFKIKIKDLPQVALLGLLQTTLQYFLFYVGLSHTTGVKGSIITSAGTFFAVALPHFFYADDRLDRKKLMGLSLGIAGVVYINMGKGGLDNNFTFTGEGFLILCSIVSAFSSILGKNITRNITPMVMNFYSLLIGSSAMIIISFCFTGGNVIPMTPSFIPMLVYLGFISAGAFTLWYHLLKYNKVSKIAIHKFQIPFWGVVLTAALIPGEHISARAIVALLLVCAGIVIASMGSGTSKHTSNHTVE